MLLTRLLPPLLKRTILALALAGWLLAPAAVARAAEDRATPNEKPGGAHEVRSGGHEGTGEAAGTAGGHEEKKDLLPNPSDPQTWFSAIWVLVIFIVLLVVLYPTAWKNVLAGLKAREQRIRQSIADAESARAKAEETLREYNTRLATAEQQVRDIIDKGSRDAEQIANGIRARAQEESQRAKEQATRDIEAARNQAIAQIYDEAATLSTNIAEKILRRNLNPDDQRDLVAESLNQLQKVG
jgi:F-type H+-transporting ATPase subunit b